MLKKNQKKGSLQQQLHGNSQKMVHVYGFGIIQRHWCLKRQLIQVHGENYVKKKINYNDN